MKKSNSKIKITDVDYIIRNYGEMTRKEMAGNLNLNPNTVLYIISRLGLAKKAEESAANEEMPAKAVSEPVKTLKDYTPRELMSELAERDYKGVLEFAEVKIHRINIESL